jgi:hypothetical protein
MPGNLAPLCGNESHLLERIDEPPPRFSVSARAVNDI